MKAVSDAVLVRRYCQGDIEAFESLLKRHKATIGHLALRMLKNEDEVEEAFQEVSIILYRKLHTFKGKSKFKSWLYRVVFNTCAMRIRSRKKNRLINQLNLTEVLAETFERVESDHYGRLENHLIGKQLYRILIANIDRLPADRRPVFILHAIGENTAEETAVIMGITTAAAKSRIHRAKITLQARLRRAYRELREAA